jgi:hypothetical protein
MYFVKTQQHNTHIFPSKLSQKLASSRNMNKIKCRLKHWRKNSWKHRSIKIVAESRVIWKIDDVCIKFIYSEKATKFCEIFTLLLSYVVSVKSKVKISQNCVAFSEYMNFKSLWNSNSRIEFCTSFCFGWIRLPTLFTIGLLCYVLPFQLLLFRRKSEFEYEVSNDFFKLIRIIYNFLNCAYIPTFLHNFYLNFIGFVENPRNNPHSFHEFFDPLFAFQLETLLNTS